jgi:hypothetical protein
MNGLLKRADRPNECEKIGQGNEVVDANAMQRVELLLTSDRLSLSTV